MTTPTKFYAGLIDDGLYKVFEFDPSGGAWTYILSPGPATVAAYGLESAISVLADLKTYLGLSGTPGANASARVKTELGAGWSEITINPPDTGGASCYVKALKAFKASEVFFVPYAANDDGPNNGLFKWDGASITKLAVITDNGGSGVEAKLVQGMDGTAANNLYFCGYVFNNTRGLWKWNGSTISNGGAPSVNGEYSGVGIYGSDIFALQTIEGDFPSEAQCCKLWQGVWGDTWAVLRDFTTTYTKPVLNAIAIDPTNGDVWVLIKNAGNAHACVSRWDGSTWTDWDLYTEIGGSLPINPHGIAAVNGKCMVTAAIASGSPRVTCYYDGSSWSAKALAGVDSNFPIPIASEPLTVPPNLQNRNPAPDAKWHDVAEDLFLEIVDADADLVSLSVKIWVQGQIAWQNDAQQTGFTVTKTSVTNGFRYRINPSSSLPEREISIRVYAEDAIPNVLDETYLFLAGDREIGKNQTEAVEPESVMDFGEDGYSYPDLQGPTSHLYPSIGRGVAIPGPVNQQVTSGRFPADSTMDFGEDAHTFPEASGPESYLLDGPIPGYQAGVLVPGPTNAQPDTKLGPKDEIGVMDAEGFPSALGDIRHTYPQVGRGVFAAVYADKVKPQNEVGVSDSVFFDLGDQHDYAEDKYDSDANELLDGHEIRAMIFHDSVNDPWHTAGAGFYGAGRDGSFRYNGQACGPGDFGSLAGGVRQSAWTDGSNPYGAHWKGTVSGDSITMIADGKARMAGTLGAAGAWGSIVLASWSRWSMTGDFDLEMRFENFASAGGSDGGLSLECGVDWSNYAYVRRNGPLGRYDADVRNAGTWTGAVTAATTDTYGRFRITRVGSTVTLYRWDNVGSAWVSMKSYAMTHGNKRFWIRVCLSGYNAGVVATADVFGWLLTSGTWTNQTSWAREAFGADRGNADAFPQRACIVATQNTVEIIDTDTDKLWMRFRQGSANVLHLYSGTRRPMELAFKDGVLLVAYGYDDATGTEGGLIVIDFTLDTVRIHRQSASTVCGGRYNTSTNSDDATVGWQAGDGNIAYRNSDFGYNGDYDLWEIPHYSVNACALRFDGGYEFRAAATRTGISVHRWRRFYLGGTVQGQAHDLPDWSKWLETYFCRWAKLRESDGTLFWVADNPAGATLHSISKAGYEAPMHAGSFAAATSKVLPGTRWGVLAQYKPDMLGSNIYVPSNEGAWLVSWPSGSWSLLFGKPGSGATFEVLEEGMNRVTSLKVFNDGAYDLIAMGVEVGATSQVFIHRLDTGALYCKTPVVGAKTTIALAA